MKAYINTDSRPPQQGLLRLNLNGVEYRPAVRHATLDEVSECPERRTPAQHYHRDYYHLVLITAGDNHLGMAGEEVAVTRHALLLCEPGIPHRFSPSQPGCISYHEVTFSFLSTTRKALTVPFGELLESLTGLASPELPRCIHLTTEKHNELASGVASLVLTMTAPGPLQSFRGVHQLAAILALVQTAALEQEIPIDNQEAETRVDRIRRFIETHCAVPLDIESMAEKAQVSRSHFLRCFKKITGTSPLAYRNQLRIGAARNLLLSTSLSNEEIAIRLGYCDAYHFGRAFKQATGFPPGQFRRQQTN